MPASIRILAEDRWSRLRSNAIVAAGVVWLARRLRARFDSWNATLLALLLGIIVVGVGLLVLPRAEQTPPGFPAGVLWQFRVSSLAAQGALWATIGLVFGALTDRALRTEHERSTPARRPETAPR